MKTKSKALLLALCAVLLVAASVLGTLAYLTSQDQVTNTFTVGSVSITLDEQDVDNDTNKADNLTYGEGESAVVRDKANSYKLLPGHQYDKDPIVHVDSDSEDCYLFVVVKNEIAAIESNAEGDKTVADQIAENGWNEVGTTEDGILYVYGAAENPTAVEGGENKTVFATFKIDGDKVVNVPEGETLPEGKIDLSAYENLTIVVTAYAVQVDGFEDDAAADIWNTAFSTPALQGQ